MKNLLFVLIATLFSFSACKKAQNIVTSPQATFSTNIISGQEPLEKDVIQLTNTSSDNSSYLWDFGNGTTSTEKNPSVAYSTHGVYTIELIVTDSKGLKSTTSHDVLILCRFRGGDHNTIEVL